MACGIDCGSYNVISARRVGKDVKCAKLVNAFLEVPLERRAFFNMMRANKEKPIPIIEREKVAYVLGEAAFEIDYALQTNKVRRPMQDGVLNPQERDAFEIMATIVHGLVGEPETHDEKVFFCVPAGLLGKQDVDVDYHQDVLASMFDAIDVNGKKVKAFPIREGLALVYAELADKNFTGIGISFGSGLINWTYSVYATEVRSFSVVGAGDWIDQQAAKASGETPSFINRAKESIDLTAPETTVVERAIATQYRLLVKKMVTHVQTELTSKDVRSDAPLDIVIGGGTASPPGFVSLVETTLRAATLPFKVGTVRLATDHLYAVARGCLVAAEFAAQ